MCMLRKRLPYNQKTKDKLAKLPKIYLVACWAHYGVLDFPFSGKYKKVKDADSPLVRYIPLVWDFDDHNGVYPEYVLRPITWTTTAAIRGWVSNEQQAKDTAEFCEKRRIQAQEYRTQMDAEWRHIMQLEREESDTDQAGSDISISPAENDEKYKKDEDKERPKEYNMKYYSEMTDKVYETQEECEKAEEALVAKKKAEEEKQLALKNERETRSKAVVDAFKKAREAETEAQKLLKEFVKDYGSFHMSYNGKSSIPSMFDILDNFFLL